MHATGDPELFAHHSVFVYPFRHQLVGAARLARLASLERRWVPWAGRFSETELAARLEATGFFFPYLRDLLYPEVPWARHQSPDEDCQDWAELLRPFAAEGLGVVGREFAPGVLRLTLRDQTHACLEEFLVRCPGNYALAPADLPARCDWIDAELYPSGIGFLLFRVRLDGPRPRLSQLIRLNQALRQVLPPSRRSPVAELESHAGDRFCMRDLMNFLTQGLAAPWDVPEGQRGVFPPPAPVGRPSPPYADSEAGHSYGERCHLLCFAGCPMDGVTGAGPFPTPADRVVFELAACVGLGQAADEPAWVPSAEQAARYCRDNRISLWRCWTGMALKESVVFLGTEDISYNRRSLPRQVENDYLPLYVFTLYQKAQLFTFSNELLRDVALSSGRLTGARGLLQRFVSFRSRYWFGEVTRKPQGGELYRTFQRGLEVQASYDMVTSGVKDVKDYYEAEWARRVQWLKDGLTFGGPVLVALGAVRMVLDETRYGWTLGVLALVLALIVGLFAAFRGRGATTRRRGRGRNKPLGTLAGTWRAQSAPTAGRRAA